MGRSGHRNFRTSGPRSFGPGNEPVSLRNLALDLRRQPTGGASRAVPDLAPEPKAPRHQRSVFGRRVADLAPLGQMAAWLHVPEDELVLVARKRTGPLALRYTGSMAEAHADEILQAMQKRPRYRTLFSEETCTVEGLVLAQRRLPGNITTVGLTTSGPGSTISEEYGLVQDKYPGSRQDRPEPGPWLSLFAYRGTPRADFIATAQARLYGLGGAAIELESFGLVPPELPG